MKILEKYVHSFTHLHTAKIGMVNAPHKPVLLLAILAEIEAGRIKINRIYITPDLVATFKNYWHKLVRTSQFTDNFALPFFHLRSEGYWQLHTAPGKEILLTSSKSIRSFGQLRDAVDFASLDQDLFELLCSRKSRDILKLSLIRRYFPNAPKSLVTDELVQSIINQMLFEPPNVYKRRAASFSEEELFVRGALFKREIPKIYNYSCCVSGMRIVVDQSVQMVDACHIIPFSESGDDTITNGISLCPNLHRAFDRGLISINDDYTVAVKKMHEETSIYSIKQFENKPILLPQRQQFYPSLENLRLHRHRFGFN